VFVLPSGGASLAYPDHSERFYSFDYGPAHVVVLDTELAVQDAARRQDQIAWLTDDLARTSQPWKIAVFHRSPFSAGGEHGSDLAVRSVFTPIFEAYGVALVLSGHEHDYERTKPLRETAEGSPVTYIVTGGGGGPLYPAAVASWTAMSRSAFRYVRGEVSTCTIAIEAVGLDGVPFDSLALDRCTTGPPPPASWTPFGGTAARLPGVVEAEKFDEGGSGSAYRDSTSGNAGGVFRAGDVDIERTSDSGSGYNVGWMTAGEWLAYSVDVADSGTYAVEARVAANGTGGTFHLEVDGTDVTGPMSIPNTGGWQAWRSLTQANVPLTAGRHRLRLVADANGPTGVFGNVNYIRFSTASASPPEIVVYASEASRIAGSWNRVADSSAAGGLKLVTPDTGWSTTDAPLAAPRDYVDVTFGAPANVAYRLWLRLRATGDTKFSESVWVQFSDAVTTSGAPAYRLDTSQALLVNLEDCSGCGVAGWGWQNRAYWLPDGSAVKFTSSGEHTIRIQVREDGVQWDQLVLSPAEYLSSRPGALKNDSTIVPKRP
jgi:hypothetical protein